MAVLYRLHTFVLTAQETSVVIAGAGTFCDFVMPLDTQKYFHFVEGFDLSDAQKRELIRTVYSIMESFVDQAFGVHPLQHMGKNGSDKDCNGKDRTIESREHTLKKRIEHPSSPPAESLRDS